MADDSVRARASKGGYARAAAMTPEARRENARKAVRARWAKARLPTVIFTFSGPPEVETQSMEIVRHYHAEPTIVFDPGASTTSLAITLTIRTSS